MINNCSYTMINYHLSQKFSEEVVNFITYCYSNKVTNLGGI